MAKSSSHQQEKETHADTRFDDDPELNDSEIDSYILSVPDLSKMQGEVSKKKSKAADISEPSTPKRVQSATSLASYDSGSGLNLLAPQGHRQDRRPPKTNTSSPGTPCGDDTGNSPKVPRKNIGWMGTDARVWSSRGYKSPCKAHKSWVG